MIELGVIYDKVLPHKHMIKLRLSFLHGGGPLLRRTAGELRMPQAREF